MSLPRTLLVALLVAGPLWAGTAVQLGVPELLARSDLCLEGRVIGARAVLAPRGRIDTEYTVQVDRTWWGEPRAVRAIRIPGGVLPDGRGMLVPGLPRLALGEDAILFLSKADPDGLRMPIGLAQGRLRLGSVAGGRKILVRDQAGLELAQDPGAAPRAADERAVLDYAEVVAEIDAAVARRRAGGRGGR